MTICLLSPGSDRHAGGAILLRAAEADPPRPGCSGPVDHADPLAVAGAVASWLYCPPGQAGILSPHGREVLGRWSSPEVPGSPATVSTLVFLDPRAAPVVVYAVLRRSSDPVVRGVVLTLYRSPTGGWVVDDLAVGDG